jgi:iron complex outermembrane receptor protein
MKKSIYLSLVVVAVLHGAEELESIDVIEEFSSEVVENVSGEEVKSADLSEALAKKIPSVSLIRRSGIANDIILRGQKRDNINVTIDGVKICGACVNRMDPPLSHVVTNAIDDVEVQEGPFNVEDFGALSGSVKVRTKKPSKELSGEINLNAGSFGYQKLSGTISGGTDKVRLLFTASNETGDQYEDGNGDDFAEQLENYTEGTTAVGSNYSDQYRGMDAFEKTMYMGKVFINPTEDQEIRLSYTANRSDDILYPSSKMDAIYDDSDVLNAEYSIKNLGEYSKKLDLQVYNSQVEHPMSTEYRVSGADKYMVHKLTTEMTGVKIKNSVDAFGDREITYGVDTSQRNWDGHYFMGMKSTGMYKETGTSIDDVDTDNVGLFVKCKRDLGKVKVEWGARYDDTSIDTKSATEPDNDYQDFSLNLFASYSPNSDTKYFVGAGKSSRVPDARELYNTKFKKSDDGSVTRIVNGNPDLDQTTNYELDLGVEKYYGDGKVELKTFYSKLKDYIYYNGSLKKNNFENIDATIYGAELSGSYMASDSITLDAGLAYKKGEKDTQPTGQTNSNLAEITPLKLNASVTYDYDSQGSVELSVQAADAWDDVDSDNGEQKLAGYGVMNLKTTREFDNGIRLTAGVDNLLDKTYAITNTYKDLILMTDGSDTMLINEPGRYMYLNASYAF